MRIAKKRRGFFMKEVGQGEVGIVGY